MQAAERSRPAKPWLVKRAGPCDRCGVILTTGSVGVYDQRTRTIRHVECPGRTEPPTQEPPGADEPTIDFGVPGASARRAYERRIANDKARTKAKWRRLAPLVEAWNGERQSTRAWAIGAAGEAALGRAIADLPGAQVLHGRRVPRSKANIDHLILGPAGVFVVDAKNHSGTVHIRDKGSFFRPDSRLYVGSRDCSKLAEAMTWQVDAVKSARSAAGVDPLPPIVPVLCFARADWPLLFPPDTYRGVRLEGLRSLKKLVVGPATLGPAEVDRYARVLAAAFPPK